VWSNGKCPEWSQKNAEILALFLTASVHLESVGHSDLLPQLRKAGYDDASLVSCTTENLVQIGFDLPTAKGLLAAIPPFQSVKVDLPNGVYTGTTFRGVLHGDGVFTFKGGSCYKGQWRYGRRDGYGVMHYKEPGSDPSGYSWSKGDIYDGGFKRNVRHGACQYTWSTGETLKCTWTQGRSDEWMRMNTSIMQARAGDVHAKAPAAPLPGIQQQPDVLSSVSNAIITKTKVAQMLHTVESLLKSDPKSKDNASPQHTLPPQPQQQAHHGVHPIVLTSPSTSSITPHQNTLVTNTQQSDASCMNQTVHSNPTYLTGPASGNSTLIAHVVQATTGRVSWNEFQRVLKGRNQEVRGFASVADVCLHFFLTRLFGRLFTSFGWNTCKADTPSTLV